jgi:FtsZ-interacting cell division protein ZipA
MTIKISITVSSSWRAHHRDPPDLIIHTSIIITTTTTTIIIIVIIIIILIITIIIATRATHGAVGHDGDLHAQDQAVHSQPMGDANLHNRVRAERLAGRRADQASADEYAAPASEVCQRESSRPRMSEPWRRA